MNNSILSDIKKLLGLPDEYMVFDSDIIININSCLYTLKQIGVPIKDDFIINGYEQKWNDMTDAKCIDIIKTYIYLKVKEIFDPPSSSIVAEAYRRTISELEWRISCSVDSLTNTFDKENN